jgi:hypothetical protein
LAKLLLFLILTMPNRKKNKVKMITN